MQDFLKWMEGKSRDLYHTTTYFIEAAGVLYLAFSVETKGKVFFSGSPAADIVPYRFESGIHLILIGYMLHILSIWYTNFRFRKVWNFLYILVPHWINGRIITPLLKGIGKILSEMIEG